MIWLVNQNPISDQHHNKFPSSDQGKITVNIICEGLLLIFFSIMMKKWLLKKYTHIQARVQKSYPFYEKDSMYLLIIGPYYL